MMVCNGKRSADSAGASCRRNLPINSSNVGIVALNERTPSRLLWVSRYYTNPLAFVRRCKFSGRTEPSRLISPKRSWSSGKSAPDSPIESSRSIVTWRFRTIWNFVWRGDSVKCYTVILVIIVGILSHPRLLRAGKGGERARRKEIWREFFLQKIDTN